MSKAEVKDNVVIYTLNGVAAGEYTVAIDNLKTTGKENIARFAKVVAFEADKVAPTVVKSEKIDNKTVKVTFSEPVQGAGTWSYINKDGGTTTVSSPKLVDNNTAVELTVADDTTTVGSTITFTGVNIMDAANNLISPNPAKVDFKIEAADAVAPKVTSINQTGAKKFEVTFDKPAKAGTVTVGGASTTVAPKTEGASSDTTYVVETTSVLENPQTVVVSGFKNIDGKAMDSYSQVVSFIKDATVPTATADSKLVEVKGTQYIKLTFNTEVTAGEVTLNGSYVKDYLTTAVTNEKATAIYPEGDKSKKVLLVPVTDADLKHEDAVYDLTVTSTAVKSLSDVAMAAAKVSYTYKDVVVTNDHVFDKNDIAVAKVTDKPSEVTVTFSNKDLDRPTAVNASNYKVNGQAVKSAELTSATQVKLTLYPGQITVNGDYNVSISGVKVKDSTKVMDTVVKTTALVENVTPTVTKTILTSNGTAEVAAKATITGKNANKVTAGATTSASTTSAVEYKVVDASGTLKLQKASDSSDVIANISSEKTFTQGGVTFTLADDVAAGQTFTIATTAKVEAVKPTITVTASKDLKTATAVNAFDVYVGTEKLTGSVTSSATGKVITIELPAPLTTAQLNAGLTVKLAEGKSVTDTNGNVLDIPTAGLKVTN